MFPSAKGIIYYYDLADKYNKEKFIEKLKI